MKVVLLREPDPYWKNTSHREPLHVRELAPFVWSPKAVAPYVHRPRSAQIHDDAYNFRNIRRRGDKEWTSDRLTVHAWCGQVIYHPRTSDAVPPGQSVCATCEGRATANGHLPVDGAPADPRLSFRPRRCQDWKAPRARYYASGYRVR